MDKRHAPGLDNIHAAPTKLHHGGDMNLGLVVTVPVAKLLDALKKNLAKHKEIVEEARSGYIDVVNKKLTEKMEELRRGQIIRLSLNLDPPSDHSSEYLRAITMLEMTTDTELKLNESQAACLLQDEWAWQEQFLYANAPYSQKALDMTQRM